MTTPATPPYSPIERAGQLHFVSGVIGMDMVSKIAPADVEAQTTKAMENLAAVLKTAGLGLSDVVKTTVFLTNMDDFGAMNTVYAHAFQVPYPARSTVAVAELPRLANVALKVEIEAVAISRK